MKRYSGRMAVAALALAVASAPAMAGGRGGYWGGGYGGHSGGYHHNHGSSSSSSTGWWIGGAFALAAVGLMLAADSGPSYSQVGVYSSGVGYTSPPMYAAPVYGAPVYDAPVYDAPVYDAPVYDPPVYRAQPSPVYDTPPVAYAAPQPQYVPAQPVMATESGASTDCQRWAMNQSGYNPATPSQWTTQVMVDSYNRMLGTCMTGQGKRSN